MGGRHVARDEGTVCRDCPEPPLPGGSRCEPCRKRHNERSRARNAERKRKRQCWACGAKAVKDEQGRWLSSCEAHRGTGWRAA